MRGYLPTWIVIAIILLGAWMKMPSDHVVEMTNKLTFAPDTLRITTGDRVVWKNTSLLAHTVTADTSLATIEGSAGVPPGAQSFDSGTLDPEDEFSRTFDRAGTYLYFCIPHEGAGMRGMIVVQEQGE